MLNGISLFSGVEGLGLGLEEYIRPVCYVEIDGYAQGVLMSRIRDGSIADAPIWDDVRTFDGRPYNRVVDVVFGGFPCQDISTAGKRAGIKEDTRSGLWFQMRRVVGEVRPSFVFIENVSALAGWFPVSPRPAPPKIHIQAGGSPLRRGRGWNPEIASRIGEVFVVESEERQAIAKVVSDLAEIGYDSTWLPLQASDVGAHHKRERMFILAYPKCGGCLDGQPEGFAAEAGKQALGNPVTGGDAREIRRKAGNEDVADANIGNDKESYDESRIGKETYPVFGCTNIWKADPADLDPSSESFAGRVADGVPHRVDKLRCLGNAVVPQQAERAWEITTGIVSDEKL